MIEGYFPPNPNFMKISSLPLDSMSPPGAVISPEIWEMILLIIIYYQSIWTGIQISMLYIRWIYPRMSIRIYPISICVYSERISSFVSQCCFASLFRIEQHRNTCIYTHSSSLKLNAKKWREATLTNGRTNVCTQNIHR